MLVFLKEKPWFSRFDILIFHVFSMIFQSFFDIEFCIDFSIILDAISAPFSIPYRPFGHHFGMLFRYRFFHDFWMPFWITFGSKSISRGGIPSITFSNFFVVFSWPRFRDGFWWIWVGFGMDFDGFLKDFIEFWDHFRISSGHCLTLCASIPVSFHHVRKIQQLPESENY